jgi:predicted membrane-bound spermidine synthase
MKARVAMITRVLPWLAATLVSGATVMALEMVAVRLFAPYFGYSVYVWGTTICVVMGAMVAGYALGGRLAARAGAEEDLFFLILAGAAWQALALVTMRFALPLLAERGEIFGVAIGALVLFAPSMAALAAAVPVLVRLCADVMPAGAAAGLVSAVSTAGSMAGILGTIFWLLPNVGTEATLRALCVTSFLTAAAGLVFVPRHRRLGLPIAAAPAAMLLLVPGLGWAEGTVWTAESAYNLVRVVQVGGERMLQLNHPSSIQSVRDGGSWTGFYYDYFALGPLLVPSRRALVLGMGAGSSIQALRRTSPSIEVDAVEIDPRVVEAASRWFDLDVASDPRLRVHVMDARRFLVKDRGTYDLVQLDVYQGGPYVPFHLVTEECFRLARARMNDDALLMMNVFDRSADSALVLRLAATLRRVFPSVRVGQTGAGNFMLFAFTRVPSAERLAFQSPVLRSNGSLRNLKIRDVPVPEGAPVFTDDRAPIEEMTRRMLAGL